MPGVNKIRSEMLNKHVIPDIATMSNVARGTGATSTNWQTGVVVPIFGRGNQTVMILAHLPVLLSCNQLIGFTCLLLYCSAINLMPHTCGCAVIYRPLTGRRCQIFENL
ncbi:hypothetical protein GOODEAATRI_021586 [Goodea atripinnis]|uniref:Uncharacterized protein n=1 Tax=Goodea atripinnis TaxID=208336 RepID=A0ABV0Q032_9TELE